MKYFTYKFNNKELNFRFGIGAVMDLEKRFDITLENMEDAFTNKPMSSIFALMSTGLRNTKANDEIIENLMEEIMTDGDFEDFMKFLVQSFTESMPKNKEQDIPSEL